MPGSDLEPILVRRGDDGKRYFGIAGDTIPMRPWFDGVELVEPIVPPEVE